MINPKIPPPQEVLAELRKLTDALYEFLPEAAQQALPYFTNRSRPVNRPLISDMIRYEIKARLTEIGIPVTEEDEETEEGTETLAIPMEPLANNGLEGVFSSYRFKILRSDDGRLPTPGPSLRKQAYYGQQLALFPIAEGQPEVRLNVILLWTFDLSYRVPRLYLSIPQQGGKTRASVIAYYTELIPNPISRLEPLKPPTPDVLIEPEITLKQKEAVKRTTDQEQ